MSQVVINIAKNGYTVGSNSNGGYSLAGMPEVRVATTIDEVLRYAREELEAAKSNKGPGALFGSASGNPLEMAAQALGVPLEALQKIVREKCGVSDPSDPFNLGEVHPDNDDK